MRHRVSGRKLNRSTAHRLALKRNLAKSLLASFGEDEYIVTTREKAKFAQPFVEKLITLGKVKTLHNIRRAVKLLQDNTVQVMQDETKIRKPLIKKLFNQIGPRYKDRPGGYTRILRTGRRRLGDKAGLVLFGFVQESQAEAGAAASAEE